MVVESLEPALRPGLDVDAATDILWTLNHPNIVDEHGWTRSGGSAGSRTPPARSY